MKDIPLQEGPLLAELSGLSPAYFGMVMNCYCWSCARQSASTLSSFSRDVTHIGHWGTGNLELNVRTAEDWDKAKVLVE